MLDLGGANCALQTSQVIPSHPQPAVHDCRLRALSSWGADSDYHIHFKSMQWEARIWTRKTTVTCLFAY